METTTEQPAPETETESQEIAGGTDPRRLQRSTTDRLLAGVAGGVGEYLRVDPIIVRIAVVVLSLFGGLGLVLYGAGWLLMPEPGRPSASSGLLAGTRRHQALVIIGAVLIGILTVRLLSRGPWWDWNGWHAGQSLGWLVVVVVIGFLVLRGFHLPISPRRLIGRLSLCLGALVVVVILGALIAELITGVPLSGGIGSKAVRPISAAQIAPTYRAGIGNLTVDLRDVTFPDRTIRVTATVGVGRLLIEVPDGLAISLTAHSGVGDVNFGPEGQAAFNQSGTKRLGAHSPLLILSAQAGLGEVQLVRGVPGVALASPPLRAPCTVPSPPVAPQ